MKIKHFVITRFLTSGGLGLKEKIFDNNIILESINYVKSYFILSLNNQTNKNFEIIFLINDKHDEINSNIKLLNTLNTDIKIHIIKYSNLYSFLKKSSLNYDYLITTRMDYDDLIYNDSVKEIQEITNKYCPKYLLTYGYNNGLMLRNNKLYKFNPNYVNGYFSVFLSLIINLHNIDDIIDIGKFGKHNDIKKNIIKFCQEKNISYNDNMFINSKNDKYYFVWVRHNNTASSLLNYNKEYNYNEEVIINNFKLIFGKNYEYNL